MSIKTDLDKIIDNGRIEDMRKLTVILEEAIDLAKDCDPEWYHKIETCLYEMANGKILTEEMAHEWVESMQPLGEKWSMYDTTSVAEQYGIRLDPLSWYVVMNMMINDYRDTIGDNLDLAVGLAKDWLNDKDSVEHKLYCYYKYIVHK